MPDTRSHRGPHPEDGQLFSPSQKPLLRAAVEELSWLLSRGYAPVSSLKLTGDRHALRQRQRELVFRAACTDAQRALRARSRREPSAAQGADLLVDGFNLLITVETALGGGVVFQARDGTWRDLSSVHGTYRSVEETPPALEGIGGVLAALEPASVTWLLDAPVSNSGNLAGQLRALAEERGWPWEARLSRNPDQELMAARGALVVSTDSLILDHAPAWLPLGELVVRGLPSAFLFLDFSETAENAAEREG